MSIGPRPRRDDEQGFSLVELMVVVLVMAVLIAVAIPTYLGARDRANDRSVQSNVRNAFVAARIYYNQALRYTEDVDSMLAIDPSIAWTNDPLVAGAAPSTVHIKAHPDGAEEPDVVVLTGRTNEGRCFYLRDVMGGEGPGTYYSRDVDGSAECPVADPDEVADPSWIGG